jgi:hypothetical protein
MAVHNYTRGNVCFCLYLFPNREGIYVGRILKRQRINFTNGTYKRELLLSARHAALEEERNVFRILSGNLMVNGRLTIYRTLVLPALTLKDAVFLLTDYAFCDSPN